MRVPNVSRGADRRPATYGHPQFAVVAAKARLVDLRYIKKLAQVAECVAGVQCSGTCSQGTPCADPACNCVNSQCT